MAFSVGLGILPVIWSIFTLSAPILGYSVAVSSHHLYPFLPAISDTGSREPEANIFSMLMNLSVFSGIFNIYVRFYQCDLQIQYCRDIRETLVRLNRTGVVFAVISIVGAIVVSNFHSRALAHYCDAKLLLWMRSYYKLAMRSYFCGAKDRALVSVHDAGAVLLFTFGGFYFWIQTILGYLMRPYGIYSGCICHLRLIMTTTITLCSIIFFTGSAYGYEQFAKHNHHHTISQWMPADGGYAFHVVGNTAEWLALFSFVGMSLSYYSEFEGVSITVTCREKQMNPVSPADALSEYAPLRFSFEDCTEGDRGSR
eukprot:gene407-10074_t